VSRLRLNKIATPATPAAGKGELFYATALAPDSPAFLDENGYLTRIGAVYSGASIAGSSAAFAVDTYIPGTMVNVGTLGMWQVGMGYRASFDMVKTAAGVATPAVTLRIGPNGNVTDPAILTFTFGAGTAVADSGVFVVEAGWSVVGATLATVRGLCELRHQLASTGLTSTGTAGYQVVTGLSANFNSLTSQFMGLSFNGGAAFSGTNVYAGGRLIL
jgi:hypothetical protein